MILRDEEIKSAIKDGKIVIEPFEESCLRPAGYNLHLSNRFKIFNSYKVDIIDMKSLPSGLMENVEIEENGFFVLHPGKFVLALARERLNVGKKYFGKIEVMENFGRFGLVVNEGSELLEPGRFSNLTLKIYNFGPLPIKLYPGSKVARIMFEELGAGHKVSDGFFGTKKDYDEKNVLAEKVSEGKDFGKSPLEEGEEKMEKKMRDKGFVPWK